MLQLFNPTKWWIIILKNSYRTNHLQSIEHHFKWTITPIMILFLDCFYNHFRVNYPLHLKLNVWIFFQRFQPAVEELPPPYGSNLYSYVAEYLYPFLIIELKLAFCLLIDYLHFVFSQTGCLKWAICRILNISKTYHSICWSANY